MSTRGGTKADLHRVIQRLKEEIATLRVVPPEGPDAARVRYGPTMDDVSDVRRASENEARNVLVSGLRDTLSNILTRVYREGLAASGAGTRQEEPSDEQCRKWALRQVEERGTGDVRSCGHAGFEEGCSQCWYEIGKRCGHVEAGAYYTHAEAMQSLGGEPPQ